MTYVVTAPLVLARDADGAVHHCYQGAHIDTLSDEQEKHFLAEGLVEKVGGRKPKAKADKGGDGQDGDGDPDDELAPPPHAAVKEAWVEFVVAKTADTDKPVTAEEADAMSKADLIELYG